MDVPPPGGSYQGSGDHASTDIGPPETEYGCAIHCDAADSRTLRGGGAVGGDTGPTTIVVTTRDRLEAGAGTRRKGGGISRTGRSNCREGDDRYTRIGKGNGGGGVTGGQWLQWG